MIGHVVVISDLSMERDGPTTIAVASMRHLRAKGIPVSFICGDDGNNAELKQLGVEIHPVGGVEIGLAPALRAATDGLYNARAARVVSDVIAKLDGPSVVYHLHNWTKILSPSIFGSLRRVADRLVITTHDYFMACPNGGYFDFNRRATCELTPLSMACLGTNCDRRSYGQKLWRVARDVERRTILSLAKSSVTLLAVHPGMVDHLVRGGIDRNSIRVLRNPVQAWSDQRIPAERNRKFMFVGRLEHDKGADLLAEAARRANVPLMMIGDGPLRPLIERSYPDVELAGWTPRARLPEYAQQARAVVVPTGSRETFALVAFEGIRSGLPVVISDFATTSREIVDTGVGISCNPYDGGRLEEILRSLAADDSLVETYSWNAWRQRDGLTVPMERWGDELIEIYRGKLPQPHTFAGEF